jgi:glycosyltransferase involved in cell wall biosynthesis
MSERHLVVFSKYFGHAVGGAEASMLERVKAQERAGYQVTVVRVENLRSLGARSRRVSLPRSWQVDPLRLAVDLFRFRYVDYILNRRAITRHFARYPEQWELLTYGLLAPAAIAGFRGRSTYAARDEYGLGWDRNYYRGPARWLRSAYERVQAPARRRWLDDLHVAIRRSALETNSQFMARELRRIAPDAEIAVHLPEVDCAALRRRFAAAGHAGEAKGIVAVGDSRIKGGDIVHRLARRLPHEVFYIFDKAYRKARRRANVVCLPWTSDPVEVYRLARLVIVPSRWEEAYPRVVVESQCLGLPVVASNRGGIPEALADHRGLVMDLEDLDEWQAKIALLGAGAAAPAATGAPR